MSSQAERIKAFKLAQHARLQKQDEEEQWISSEELCTEGSSDEETHTSISNKTSHRKQKRNPRTEKRGISPLAQPPKITETETTSTYQRDSKYLLPDMQQSNQIVEKQSTSGLYQYETFIKTDDLKSVDTKIEKLDLAQASKTHSSSLESEETDEDAEIEQMIQWRPKRGSIKLPDFPEDELEKRESTLQHTIFEVDAFYTEMVAKINFLKRATCKTKPIYDNENCEMEKLITSLEKKKKPNVNKFLKKISELDTEISEKNNLFEEIKKERLLAQEEMCNVINDMDMSPVDSKNSQIFLHMCSFEKTDNEKDVKDNNINNKSSDEPAKKLKKSEKSDRNFVTKNIKLAKERSMAQFSLTDEEKVKLETLLSDIDSEEYSGEHEITNAELKSIQNNINKGSGEKSTNNELEDKEEDVPENFFKLEKNEMCTIEDLDSKLHEILNSYDEDGKINQTVPTNSEDLLQTADNEGRYWKHHQLQKRLEAIEKDLANIQAKDEEERKKLEPQNEEEENEDDCEEKE